MSEADFDWIRWMKVGAPCGDYLLYFMVVEFEVQKDQICGKKKKKNYFAGDFNFHEKQE